MAGGDRGSEVRQELAEGLEGDALEARVALVDELIRQGCPDDELRAAHAEGRLALLPLERSLETDGDQTLGAIAAAHGVEPEDLVRTRTALGLPVEREAPIYGASLGHHASRLRAAQDAGVPVDALVAINRVVGRSMAAIAAAGRDVIAATLGGSAGSDEHAQAMQVAGAVDTLIPLMKDVLLYAYEEHALELVRNEQAGALTMADGRADVREVAVAFADLVGFTSLGGELTPTELSAVANRLEQLAGDALRPRVSVIKTIGDEVMLASEDPAALAATVLALVTAADAEGGGFPRVRAGAAAGPAVRRAADWYGAPVNLASRLTTLAEPGAFLADAAFARTASSAVDWRPAGARRIRGITGVVATFLAAPSA